MVVLGSAGCRPFTFEHQYSGSLFNPPVPIPDFELTDSHDQPFALRNQPADYTLVFFGYTFCPDVCPLTLADIKKALTGLPGSERVRVIFISVDPERDTPTALQEYLAHFDPAYIGLTGTPEALKQAMAPFGAYAEREEVPNSAAGYLMNHTASLYLLDPHQDILLTYSFGFDPAGLRGDLAYLLKQ